MINKKTNKNAEKCPTCRKPLAKVGHTGKFRCSNPKCSVIFVKRYNDRKSKLRSGSS
jgi:uncharacterized Zn finger protein (UPF0148 family)